MLVSSETWRRWGPVRDEARQLIKMGRATTVIRLASTGAPFISTAVVGKIGPTELAAAAYATAVIDLSRSIFVDGFGSALSTLASQATGAKNGPLAGLWLQTSLVCVCALFPLAAILWCNLGVVLIGVLPDSVSSAEPRVFELATTYGRLSCLWMVPDTCAVLLEKWLISRQIVGPLIPINLVYLVLVLITNVLLVHGAGPFYPFEGYGFVGAPIATAVCTLSKAVAIGVACWGLKLHDGGWAGWDIKAALAPSRLGVFATQAINASASPLVENAQVMLVTTWAGSLGVSAIATHAAMMDLFGVATCAMMGMKDAGVARVGTFLGAGDITAARRVFHANMAAMSLLGTIVGAMFITFRGEVGLIFSNDPIVLHLSSRLSTLTGCFYLIMTLLYASYATLQGQGRQGAIAVVLLLGSWGVATPLSYILAFGTTSKPLLFGWISIPGEGVIGIWWGFVGGYGMVALMLVYLAWASDWPKMVAKARKNAEADADPHSSDSSTPLQVQVELPNYQAVPQST